MTVSGLVVTLEEEPNACAHALAALAADERVLCGEAHGLRLPLITETTTLAEAEALFEALACTRGVAFVDVVSVAFDDGVA